jgi:hypothetical protein
MNSNMDNHIAIKKIVRTTLHENFKSGFQVSSFNKEDRKADINSYVEKKLKIFCEEIKKLASENNYPYVNYHLKAVLNEMQELISNKEYKLLGIEELYL